MGASRSEEELELPFISVHRPQSQVRLSPASREGHAVLPPSFPFPLSLFPPLPPQSPSFLAGRLSEPAEPWMKWFGGSSPAAAMATRLPARPTVTSRSRFPAPELQFPECKAPGMMRETHLLDGVQPEPSNLKEDVCWHPQENMVENLGIRGQRAEMLLEEAWEHLLWWPTRCPSRRPRATGRGKGWACSLVLVLPPSVLLPENFLSETVRCCRPPPASTV